MHRLAAFSMSNRALVALVTAVVALFGVFSLTSLKQELTPSISFPQLAIVTTYPGASPDVVNSDVSTPIEGAIQGVAGLETTSATSSSNSSTVSASFVFGTDIATAEQKVEQAINGIRSTLPEGVSPQVFSGSFDDLPVLQVAVTSDGDSRTLASRITEDVLPEVKEVEGVRDAQLQGAIERRITITPDSAKLARAGFTAEDVRAALQQNGVLTPGGSITQDGSTFSVQSGERLGSISDIESLPLIPTVPAASTGAAEPAGFTIGAIATVRSVDSPVTSISLVNGKPALTIAVTKTPEANTVAVSNTVGDLLPTLTGRLGVGVQTSTVFDQAPYIQTSITSLAEEGGLGLVFAILVILLFLLSVRSTIVTAISIPTSVLITFIGLQVSGYSLNVLTLGALTIAIGRVVDDSIVVIENIKRHLELGEERASTAVTAVREVSGAITASTITTVAVFLPIAFVGGSVGELFRPFALTVAIALLASLFVALTIVPVLAYWFLRPSRAARARLARRPIDARGAADDQDETPSPLQRAYLPIIRWTLRHSVVTVIIAGLVLVGTGALFPMMKTNFLGNSGQNTLSVTQKVPVGQSLADQQRTALRASRALQEVPGVQTVQATAGAGEGLVAAFGGASSGVTYSITAGEGANMEAIESKVRRAFAGIADADSVTVSASSGFGGSSDLEVDLSSSDQPALQAAADTVTSELREAEGISQVTNNLSTSLPYVGVIVDRAKAARAGLSEAAVGTFVNRAIQPSQIGSIVIDDTTLSVYLASQDTPRTTAELSKLQIQTAAGEVPLSSIARVGETTGPVSITTQRGQRTATITATPSGDDLTAANAAVQKAIASSDLPAGVDAALGGVTADQGNAFSQLGLALLIAILIVYIVMVAAFRSLLQPLLLLVSIPFAATGAILLQIVTGVPLGVASLIGVLMLIGIVVTNAIVLVDLVNQYRTRGLPVQEALLHGASRRLRPILMTALATIFALIPMALGLTGQGGFISQPLAIVVIGGLVSSTLLTLVVLPVIYNLVEGGRERRARRSTLQKRAA